MVSQLVLAAFRKKRVRPALDLIFKAFWNDVPNMGGVVRKMETAIMELEKTAPNGEALLFCQKLLAATQTRLADQSKPRRVHQDFLTWKTLEITGWYDPDKWFQKQAAAASVSVAAADLLSAFEMSARESSAFLTPNPSGVRRWFLTMATFGMSEKCRR